MSGHKTDHALQDMHRPDDAAALNNQGTAASRIIRPRDAASLILIDRNGNEPRVLMGRRARAMHFMPDMFVFPAAVQKLRMAELMLPTASGRKMKPNCWQGLANVPVHNARVRLP
ncbi:hypothetical protein [Pseudochrobactrum algeriensis]|uniref:hypothetical protein n=1 Tax=Pseudochrobactrum algeriensis TaxID=2834768 RepID=UPI001EE628C3|nr:hypothetical protein [Pseudochrobactrum algeriensis]